MTPTYVTSSPIRSGRKLSLLLALTPTLARSQTPVTQSQPHLRIRILNAQNNQGVTP